MYRVKVSDLAEIRMGSPFNYAKVEIVGGYAPDFEGVTFQDKSLVTSAAGNAI